MDMEVINRELEKLRQQLNDKDLQIVNLQFKNSQLEATIKFMRNCENCINADYDGEKVSCRKSDKECSLPELKAWNPIISKEFL